METINERKEHEIARQKIEDGKNQLQNIFRQAPAAIAVLEGPTHIYVLANSAYQKMNSRSEEQNAR